MSPTTTWPLRAERQGRIAAALASGLGLAALIGWAFDLPLLKSLHPPYVSMKANTALGFVLSGWALMLSARTANPRSRRWARALAAFVGLLALLTLSQDIFGVEVGLDQMLLRDALSAPGTSAPGRMAPLTALCFVFVSASLIGLDTQARKLRPAQLLALALGWVALLVLIGYLYGARGFYGGGGASTEMAVHTAAGFGLVAIGLMLARPEHGFAAPFTAAGVAASRARTLLAGAVAIPFLLGGARLWGERRGHFDLAHGVALHVATVIILFSALVWWTVARESHATAALRAGQERYRAIFDHALTGNYVSTSDGRLLTANAAFLRIFGFASLDEALATGLDSLYATPEERAAFVDKVHAAGRLDDFETRLRRRDGALVDVIENVVGVRDAAGRIAELHGYIVDVTERLRRVEEIRKLYRALEQAPLSVVMTDAQGRIEYVNACFTQVTGYSRAETLGQNPRILKSGLQPASVYEELWATISSGSEWRGELRNRRKDGTLFWEDVVISPVAEDAGKVTHFIAMKQDVTERKRQDEAHRSTQVQLAQAQKTEAIGRLAGGIAHDFNNLLGVITGYGDLVLRRLAAEDPSRAKVEQMLKAAGRAAGLTRQLLAFSRKQVLQPSVLDPNALLADLVKLLERLIGEDVELVVTPSPAIGRVLADPGQLEQVVLNLAVNARDAMPEGGRLSIETTDERVGDDDPRRRGLMPAGRYVRLAVTDTGAGMSEDTLGHVFEPFFTTKETGKGTGLGLSTVYGIVKQSGGFIWVESALGRGTTFEVFLPRVEAQAGPVHASASTPSGAGGGASVLLVEDNPELRALTREVLESAGYRVWDAADGEAALGIARGERDGLALLVTDVVLPGLGGREVAAQVQRLHSGVNVLFTSGHTADAMGVHGVLEAGLAFLPKPASPSVLLAKVAEVLGKKG